MDARFRHGLMLQIAGSTAPFAAVVAAGRAASEAGFTMVWIAGNSATNDPVMVTAGLAAELPDVAVGAVIDLQRYPSAGLLAREVGSLVALAPGRCAIMLAAPASAAQALAETGAILRGWFSGEAVTFHGRHVQVNAITNHTISQDHDRPPLLYMTDTLGSVPDDEAFDAAVVEADVSINSATRQWRRYDARARDWATQQVGADGAGMGGTIAVVPIDEAMGTLVGAAVSP